MSGGAEGSMVTVAHTLGYLHPYALNGAVSALPLNPNGVMGLAGTTERHMRRVVIDMHKPCSADSRHIRNEFLV